MQGSDKFRVLCEGVIRRAPGSYITAYINAFNFICGVERFGPQIAGQVPILDLALLFSGEGHLKCSLFARQWKSVCAHTIACVLA